MWGWRIVVDVEGGLKFGCIDFSSQQKKKEGALHTDRPVFEFPNHTAQFPNQWPSMGKIPQYFTK